MPFVVTDACIKDFVCVAECPVEAIAPAPRDATAGSVPQVFIDPELCIECGSCANMCAQNAIVLQEELPPDRSAFAAMNRAYFQQVGAAMPAMESIAR